MLARGRRWSGEAPMTVPRRHLLKCRQRRMLICCCCCCCCCTPISPHSLTSNRCVHVLATIHCNGFEIGRAHDGIGSFTYSSLPISSTVEHH
jgi:hypothetical protein